MEHATNYVRLGRPLESTEIVDGEERPDVFEIVGVEVPTVDLEHDWGVTAGIVSGIPGVLNGLADEERRKAEVAGEWRPSLDLASMR